MAAGYRARFLHVGGIAAERYRDEFCAQLRGDQRDRRVVGVAEGVVELLPAAAERPASPGRCP